MQIRLLLFLLLFISFLTCFSQNKTKKYDLQSDLESSIECWDMFIFFPDSEYTVSVVREDIGLHKDSKLCHKIRTNPKKNSLIVDFIKRNSIHDGYHFFENEYVNLNTDIPIKYELIKMFVNFSSFDPCHNDDVVVLFTDVNKATKFINELTNIFNEKDCFRNLNQELKNQK